MPLTLQQVVEQLNIDEPDYPTLATLGPEAIPHLVVLVQGDDPSVAAKAAYLASLIDSDDSPDVVAAAAASPHETVRVAAGAALQNLMPREAAPMVERLLDDQDVGVRKQALRAAAQLELIALEPKLKRMAANDPEEGLRELASQGLQRFTELRNAGKNDTPAPGTKRDEQ